MLDQSVVVNLTTEFLAIIVQGLGGVLGIEAVFRHAPRPM